MTRPVLPALFLLILPAPMLSQDRDTAQVLPPIEVNAGRSGMPLERDGLAVTVVRGDEIHRGRLGTTLDDALAFVPGVTIANRWNWSLDQRLAIRGAGARANFGVRGVRIILDGVPQTLPDGQSQLNLVDLSNVERIEVIRGATSSMHGNAGGGVVAFHTRLRPSGPWQVTAGTEIGSFGSTRFIASAGGGHQDVGGSLTISRFTSDGFRAHSAVEQRRLHGGVEWQLTPRSQLTVRVDLADDPEALNPGALTLEESAADAAAAAPNNLRRRADKAVTQHQVAVGFVHGGTGMRLSGNAWIGGRHLTNPLAAPAPAPAAPEDGIWVGLDRQLLGTRGEINWQWGSRAIVTAAVDVQQVVDERVNRVHHAGIPQGDNLLDQRERVVELGPSLRMVVPLTPRFTFRVGGRHDRVTFDVEDHITPARGGERTMSAWSGDGAVVWHRNEATAWLGVGTAFETPTTTELANRPDGSTGINRDLNPQRSATWELGLRKSLGPVRLDVVTWYATTEDAITPVEDVGGRTFFANVGTTRSRGVELGVDALVLPWLMARLSGTWTDARVDATSLRIPGVPRFIARAGLIGSTGQFTFDIDHALTSDVYADDANLQRIDDWGAGITNARLGWDAPVGLTLFAFVHNAFNRTYVGSVTVNGAAGRVYEPAPGRNVGIGLKAEIP